ncbi:MAG TPA: addiction module protein [Candidatus Lokiarchaeia archaeon]|nr:addiction module protein [Candidatus Lokiarchaeia archaeon]
MASKIKEIEKEIFQLPPHERALLAKHIISTLDEGEADPDADEAWKQEVRRRYDDYKEGKVKAKPAKQVLDEARKKLR